MKICPTNKDGVLLKNKKNCCAATIDSTAGEEGETDGNGGGVRIHGRISFGIF
jgi:hypothetical protein